MSRQAGWLAQNGLYSDCYALCLPLCLFGLGSQVVTSVGRGCTTLSGMVLSVVFVCLESGDWRNVYWGLSFFLFGTGDIPDSWLFVLLVPQEPPLIVSFVVSFVYEAVRGFPCFP